MKVVITAGGRGTRISSVAADIPKPMIKISGKPVLEHELCCLKGQGFTDFIITVGYLRNAITDYFSDGSRLGVKIEYYVEESPLGTAGALFELRDKLKEDFLLLNADVLFDVDFNRFVDFHYSRGGMATLFTHPNSHPYDSGLIVTDDNGMVLKWLTKEDARDSWYGNRVNAGLHILSPKILDNISYISGNRADLDRQLLKPLANSGRMYAYDSPEYVKDMGTPERYETVCSDFVSGKVRQKNLKNKQKAIFMDRDGTINKYVGFLTDIDDFQLLPEAADAVKIINESGYLAIVVTNQPVVARGEVTFDELRDIHNKMETLLGAAGAYVDKIYCCPHHPHKGYKGEIYELKRECTCRKPKPGMILQAAKEFNIDLSQSWMIGDSKNDISAGKAAGCKTALIGNGDYGQDLAVASLIEFVNAVVR